MPHSFCGAGPLSRGRRPSGLLEFVDSTKAGRGASARLRGAAPQDLAMSENYVVGDPIPSCPTTLTTPFRNKIGTSYVKTSVLLKKLLEEYREGSRGDADRCSGCSLLHLRHTRLTSPPRRMETSRPNPGDVSQESV